MFFYISYKKQLKTSVYCIKTCMDFSLLNSTIWILKSVYTADGINKINVFFFFFSFSRTNPVQYKTGIQTHAEEETLRKFSANRSLLFY